MKATGFNSTNPFINIISPGMRVMYERFNFLDIGVVYV